MIFTCTFPVTYTVCMILYVRTSFCMFHTPHSFPSIYISLIKGMRSPGVLLKACAAFFSCRLNTGHRRPANSLVFHLFLFVGKCHINTIRLYVIFVQLVLYCSVQIIVHIAATESTIICANRDLSFDYYYFDNTDSVNASGKALGLLL